MRGKIKSFVPIWLLAARRRWMSHACPSGVAKLPSAAGKSYDIRINWYCRLGNNILQVLHAYCWAKATHSRLSIEGHSLMRPTVWDFSNGRDELTKLNAMFFYPKFEGFAGTLPTLTEIRRIGVQHILPILRLPPITAINETVLVAHVRSGDIFGTENGIANVHSGYVPPPVSFYAKAMQDSGCSKLLIVTEPDMRNPVLAILRARFRADVQSQTMAEDLATLVSARKLCIGNSTFSWAAFLISPFADEVFMPAATIFSQPPPDPPVRIRKYMFRRYSRPFEWTSSPGQLRSMVTHPIRYVVETR